MKKYLLPIFILSVLTVGLAASFLLVKQTQNLKNKAAVSNGVGSVSLVPSTSTIYPSGTLSANLKFNTGGAVVSTVSVRISYPYTGSAPTLDVVDANGNVSSQVFPDSGLTSTGDWSFPVKSVTRANGRVTIDLAAIDTNVNGFSSTSDTNLATIYFKASGVTGTVSGSSCNLTFSSNGQSACTALPVVFTFDTSASQMLTKANPPADILKTSANATYTVTADLTAPNAISDLSTSNITASAVTLNWSAPTDTGPSGRASSYDVRYSTSPITSSNWSSATPVINSIVPKAAGGSESFVVGSLSSGITYYFAVKSSDAIGNVSNLSNVVSAATTVPCTSNAATLTLDHDTQTGSSGQKVDYQLTVVNNNTGSCGTQAFAVSLSGTTGSWVAAINPSTLNLASGASGNATISLTPNSSVVNNSYSFTATVTSPGGTASKTLVYVVNNVSVMNLKVKFQGVTSADNNYGGVALVLKNGANALYNQTVSVTPDASGVYTGIANNIVPGTYDVYVKEATHLQRKFANVSFPNGTLNADFTGALMLAGDFNSDNVINISDIASMLSIYTQLSVPVNTSNKIYDVNGDGVINITDIAIVLSNYTALQVNGD